ncbi:RNA-directed DNA polymerase from mobile element jockey [Plakobranchus ocellatus]|uniref:RNA-directed DNA polymerase from mobile element jockey n=1 Tax=Plakobranchus ocellatus TaxID=259542 RepID=A0AAV4DSY3_9GAST|nr:RNA-directed DNA polymerase from mobile element jockey [Plakobranchus ocellatus]
MAPPRKRSLSDRIRCMFRGRYRSRSRPGDPFEEPDIDEQPQKHLLEQIQNKLEATEMWFLRRMLRIPWTAKKTNEKVLNEANKRRLLVRTIRKRDEKRKTGTFGNNRKV